MARSNRPTVLVVDDEVNIRDAIAFNLKREGFDVLAAAAGLEALEKAQQQPDVVVLDLMLPGIDGFEVLRRLRTFSNVPVLMLSAKGDEIDRVVGLEIGADDYIAKPFAMRELVARIRAIVRRQEMSGVMPVTTALVTESVSPSGSPLVRAGDLVIDIAGRLVTLGDKSLDLKPKEFDLLVYFAKHPGVVLSRDALLREVWGYDYPVDTRTVDVHIRWLRTKLEETPGTPTRLLTVRGAGYRFIAEPAGART